MLRANSVVKRKASSPTWSAISRAKLEPIGKLDALDGVGSRVLAYYKN